MGKGKRKNKGSGSKGRGSSGSPGADAAADPAPEPKPKRQAPRVSERYARAPLPGLPPESSRRRVNAVIGTFLFLNLFIPLTFYMGNDDRDERFAWRMYSATRAEVCQAAVSERVSINGAEPRERKVSLAREIHQAWANGIKMGRPDIVDGFLTWRCQTPDVVSVKVHRTCRSGAGRPLPDDIQLRDCTGGGS